MQPDICIALFSGESGHRKLKLVSLLYRCRRRIILAQDFESYVLSFKTWPKFAVHLIIEEKSLGKHALSIILRPILVFLSLFADVYLLIFAALLFSKRWQQFKKLIASS
jgi:hypothetical protein